MKLGIFMLVLGLIIAAGGTFFWQNYNPSLLGYRPGEGQMYYSAGIAGMVLGGGLAFGGIVRMIVKR